MLNKIGKKYGMRTVAWVAMMALWIFGWGATARAQAVTASKLITITTSGLNAPDQMVQDSCGNLYELDSNDNLYEIPAGANGAATQLVLSKTTEGGGLAIGPDNTLYMSSYQWDGKMLKVPVTTSASGCVPQPAQAAEFAAPGSAEGYWYFPQAVAVDPSSNLFLATSGKQILEYNATNATLSVLLSGLASTPDFIAVDASENVYYTFNSSGTIYEIPYSSSSGYAAAATSISTSLVDAAGMTFDKHGNLFVTDSSTHVVYEIPYSIDAKALVPANAFPVAAQANNYLSTAQDGKTLLFALPQYTGTTLSALQPGVMDFGNVALGSSANAMLNFYFNSAVAPASIAIAGPKGVFANTGSGSCAASSYSAGSFCTVALSFTPSTAGRVAGGVVLADANGAPLATGAITGIGGGAALTVDPGTVAPLGGGYTAPKSIAMDSAGDLFIADAGANTLWEIAAGSSTATALATGFNAPKGVAVDGAGNVYVADTGNNQIVEIPVVNGALSATAQTTLISSSATLAGASLNAPEGIAVDGKGNLYLADSGNKRVVDLPYVGSWNPSLAQTLGSGMSQPSAVTVDANGNVYVADAGNGNVYELSAPLSAGVQVTVASGYSNPSSLVADASGSLFVVDQGNQKVWRIPAVSGALTPSSAINVTGQLGASGTPVVADPYGVTLDPSGNVYVTDSMNAAAYVVTRTSSAQSAGIWNPASQSGTLTDVLENAGNAALSFGTPYEAATGDTTQFQIASGTAGLCANGGSVAVGASCNVDVVFAPTVDGSDTLTLTLSSNAANAANAAGQTLTFTGTGGQTVATTTTLTQSSPSGLPAYDQPVTFAVAVTSSSGTPTGGVSLSVDGIVKQTATLSSQGTASFTLAGGVLTGGSHTIVANYVGGASGYTTYSASASTPATVVVATVPTATAVSFTTLYTNPTSQPAGTAIVFTATVSSTFAGIPTGPVTFTITDASGTIVTGSGTLQPASGGAFQATYSYANTKSPASGAPVDVESVVATYGGDTNFTGSASSSSTFDVAPAIGSVGTTASGSSLTSSSSLTFTATSYGGWNGVVGFACDAATLPANARCVFSPGEIEVLPSTPTTTASNPQITMSVAINQPPQTPTASTFLWWFAGPTGMLLFFARRRFARGAWAAIGAMLAFILLGAAVTAMSACTSGLQFTTPAGASTVTVYAYSDPFTTMPSSSNPNPSTQTCGVNPSTNKADPSLTPCSITTFKVALTVQ